MKQQTTRTTPSSPPTHPGLGREVSTPHEAIKIRLEENRSLGLWTAFVRHNGQVVSVIMDSDRDDVIATARSWICNAQRKAA